MSVLAAVASVGSSHTLLPNSVGELVDVVALFQRTMPGKEISNRLHFAKNTCARAHSFSMSLAIASASSCLSSARCFSSAARGDGGGRNSATREDRPTSTRELTSRDIAPLGWSPRHVSIRIERPMKKTKALGRSQRNLDVFTRNHVPRGSAPWRSFYPSKNGGFGCCFMRANLHLFRD